MKITTALLVACASYVLAGHASSATCPSYDDISQPAVAENIWNNSKWAQSGAWYVHATNEPSLPNSTLLHCPCNVYQNQIPGPPRFGMNSYTSVYTSACGDNFFGFHNITVKLAGFWNESSRPALHWENYYNAKTFSPTMIYDAKFGETGYEWVAIYACEGPPAQRKRGFSWQLLSTQKVVKQDEIEAWASRALDIGLDVKGLELADWTKCPSWL